MFTSVRNPYKRLISSLYCPYNLCNKRLVGKDIDKDMFNRLLSDKIDRQITNYDFVYYNGKKVVPHVLKLENLTEDFNKLMFDYNCGVRMDKKINTGSNLNPLKRFGVEDISIENIKLINEKYKNDFMYFGYEMIKL